MNHRVQDFFRIDLLRWAPVTPFWEKSVLARARTLWRRSIYWIVPVILLFVDVGSAYGAADPSGGGDEKSHAFSWGLVLLCLVLGLLLTLRPAHRSEEVKRPVRDND